MLMPSEDLLDPQISNNVFRRVLLKILDERPKVRGSKRTTEDLKRLSMMAYEKWQGLEELKWVKWKKNTLIIEKI
jgi:hypothetical protein